MSKFDIARAVIIMTDGLHTADAVRKDPPVIKAYAQFSQDAVGAMRSGRVLADEVRASWKRHRR